MGKDFRGDPTSALLEILDPTQNKYFVDNYIEEEFDLSNVLFILTANDITQIPEALKDRLEIIEMSAYSDFEKLAMSKKYLIPKIFDNYLIKNDDIKIKDELIYLIINSYTKEAGVRDLNRHLETLFRKIVTDVEMKKAKFPLTINEKLIVKYLGKIPYENDSSSTTLAPGLVNSLACTPLGGHILPFESVMFDGKGNIKTTGSLGDSLKESISVAVSYIRSHEELFKVNDYYFNNKDIHINVLETAVKKEGPSAGVVITTSILSLLLNKPIPRNVAMTGEITLRGDILVVGGIKEKILAAYNNKITKIYIPASNEKDLEDIPSKVLSKLNIIKVKNYSEIYKDLFK